MKITVIGTGYVGLVSGACLADVGNNVLCFDIDESKIAFLNAGGIPIHEPGLADLVKRNLGAGRLRFTADPHAAAIHGIVQFIAVGTPADEDGSADLKYVLAAAQNIGCHMDAYRVIVDKSTVPVGTADKVKAIVQAELNRRALDLPFHVVSNPEFLKEGAAIDDFQRPDRIVIGANEQRAKDAMAEVYRPLYLNQPPLLYTSRRTSELIKYAANAFLATKITFINEIADLCENVGANVQEVARGIGLDNRIGTKFLHAGPGYGGSCFPKDTLALIKTAQDFEAPIRLIETVAAVNDQRKRAMARKVIAACGGSVRDKTIAVLGLTFKPNTDDMREAPSLSIITALQDAGATVRGFDPEGTEQARDLLTGVTLCDSAYDCINGADALVIVTEWNEFRALDMRRVKSLLKSPVVVDLRNIYRPEDMARHGFTYVSIGRPAVRS